MTDTGHFRLSPERAELLRSLLREQGIECSPARKVRRRADPAAPVPLTFSQNRLWFLNRFTTNHSAFVIPMALMLHGSFQPELFAQACDEVVRRHESLRTVFFEREGQAFQQVRADLRAEVHLVDPPGLAPGALPVELARRAERLAARPFDLGDGPPLRVELVRLGPDTAAVLLVIHHIVADLWSTTVLMRDLLASYTALVTGRPDELAELAVQYPDFALWQHEPAAKAGWDDDLAYWRRQLAGVPLEAGLAMDRRRPREKSYRGGSLPVELAPALVAGARELARAEGATLFMVLAAAITVLVARLGDNEDIVIGTPVANRPLAELEPLIGFFVNTLALRTDVTGNPTFRSVLRQVKQICLQAYEHQGLPFERLVEELQPERSMARTPLFQVMFAYRNMPGPNLNGVPIEVEPIPLDSRKAEFDLLLDLLEDGDTIWGYLEYSLDVFHEATARRILRTFQRLVRGLIADPDQRIGELPTMGADERRRVLALAHGPAAQQTGTGWPQHSVQRWARLAPAAEAIRFGGGSVTYRELNRRANRLARRLCRLGVGGGALVGVCLRPSVELVVSLLAVWKAGAAAVTVDPDCPPRPVAGLVQELAVPVLLVERAAAATLDAGPAEVCWVDEPDAPAGDDDLDVAVDGSDPAYVSYPPAAPHGVLISHAGLRDRLLALRHEYPLAEVDRVLLAAGPDVPVCEMVWPLVAGATLVLGGPDRRRLASTIRDHGVTTAYLAPSRVPELLAEPDRAPCPSLRRVVCGGPVPRDLRDRFFDWSSAHLHTRYAPAEAAGAGWRCRPGDDDPLPAGYPMAGSQLYVLDRYRQPVPAGVVGELYAGGAGLADGYLDRPELTARRFVTAQLDSAPLRLFRTGDLARLRADGAVEVVGRADRRVVLRGVRVELDEIESALVEHEQVDEAVVAAVADESGGLDLVAYVTGDPAPEYAELVGYLRQRLPDYPVPAALMPLPALPRTSAGDVDLTALPAWQASQRWTPFEAPTNDLERSIARIWRDLLDVEQVGIHDDFFELGGHSMLATQLSAKVTAAHGVELPIRQLFENPTVAELAAWIGERVGARAPASAAIPAADRDHGVPLSFAQEHMCLHHPLGGEHPVHNVATGILLRGALDESALRHSLLEIAARHESLRTRITGRAPHLVQQVVEAAAWPLDVVDLRGVPEPERRGELRRTVQAQAQRPFRLGVAPLVRGSLVRLADDEHALVLVMHHLVTDNWSYGVLVRDLCEFYLAGTAGRAPVLPDLPVQYPDFAAWQQRELAGGGLDDQLVYWRGQLKDLPALRFQPPRPEQADAATGVMRSFALDPATAGRLTRLAQRDGATLFMVLLAAFAVLLSGYSGSDDVPINFPEAGRDRAETADLIGFFVNIMVIRTDLSAAPSFRQLVRQVRDLTLAAHANRGVPLYAFDREPGGKLAESRIRFNLLNAPVPAVDLPGLVVEPLDLGSGFVFSELQPAEVAPAEVDLALVMREHESGLRGTWLYALDRIDARALASMMRQFAPLLARIAADPDTGVSALRQQVRPDTADRADR